MVSHISIKYKLFHLLLIICFYALKCFQVLLFNTRHSFEYQAFVYTQLNYQTVLFETIQFSMSTKWNGFKYCYVTLIIQLNMSFFYTQLND